MSEFKTFRLDEARVLYSANVGIEIENDICDWSAMVGHPVSKVYYRLTPEQELTFEQACLLVGLGLRGELEEDCTNEGTWRDSFGSLSPDWLYRTRPLPKQTKIIPHTMETAPDEHQFVEYEKVGVCSSCVTNAGRVLVFKQNILVDSLTFEEALERLTITATGKPYGMEVEA